MLVTFIVAVAVLAVLYLLIIVRHQNPDKPNYDFSTGAKKSILTFSHTGFGISFFVIVVEIVLYFFQIDQAALWVIFGLFLSFAILFLLLLCCTYFTYEAIRGDEVYIHRFFKVKKINVNEIRRVEPLGRMGITFYDKNNKCLFRVDSFTPGIEELICLIDEQKTVGENEDSQEDLAEETAVLEKLGREYRESYPKRRKKFLIYFPLVGIAILLAFVLLLYLVGSDLFDMVTIGLLGAFALALNFFVFLSRMKKELNEDDLSLGNKYKFKNKRVKGANKSKFKGICLVCVIYMIGGALFALLPLLLSEEAPNYEEFTQVTGILEYRREQTGKTSYIAIGLYDNPTEYRLYSIYSDEMDRSFFSEVKAGDTVTILVDNEEDREFSLRGVSKKQWNDFYYLATADKEYFTQEDYERGREQNQKAGFVIAWVGAAAFVASTVTLVASKVVCKKREKDEDIIIYK